ncbi:MAG TPA: CBS domain-containing protein [bacterium]|nr:CBS domain-containing protein [bacterium]
MLYLSQIIGKPVYDASGDAFDRVADLVIYHGTEKFPKITGILLRGDHSRVAIIPWDAVAEFLTTAIRLRVERRHLSPRPLQPDEVLLRDNIFDSQVVDTDDLKVVRVNDIELRRIGSELRVVGADVGTRSLLRRLGLEPLVAGAFERFGRPLPQGVIPWNLVAVLGGTMTPLKLTISREKLKHIHPADLADLLEELDRDERVEMMTALADETAADVLEEAEPEVQTAVIQELPRERAADVLEEMAPDEAADVLGELPEARADELISLMEEDKAEEVSRLLQYPPETAAGKMTTEFIALAETMTVEQVLARLRETKPDDESIYYLYVVDAQERLAGVLSIRSLLVSPPETPISQLMRTEVFYVPPDASVDDVAGALVKYDLLAVPVVEPAGRLVGIVTVDDLIDILVETYGPRKLGGGVDLLRRKASRESAATPGSRPPGGDPGVGGAGGPQPSG